MQFLMKHQIPNSGNPFIGKKLHLFISLEKKEHNIK